MEIEDPVSAPDHRLVPVFFLFTYVSVCIYIHTHIYTHTHVYTHVHTCTHEYFDNKNAIALYIAFCTFSLPPHTLLKNDSGETPQH